MKSVLNLRGEEIYKINSRELEDEPSGNIVAIEVESRDFSSTGNTLEEIYKTASNKYPGKKFYFRKIGSSGTISHIPYSVELMSPVKVHDWPKTKVRIAGPKLAREYEAYSFVFAGMQKSVIAEDEANELNLLYVGDTIVSDGWHIICLKLFEAEVNFSNMKFSKIIIGKPLPKFAAIKVVIGMDILY